MSYLRFLLLNVLLLGSCINSLSQPQLVDSLKQELTSAKHDTTRVWVLLKLSDQYWHSGRYKPALAKARQAEKVARQSDHEKGLAKAYSTIGIVYWFQGDYQKAIEYHKKSLRINQDIGHKIGIAHAYNNLGITYIRQGRYKKAVQYNLKGAKIREKIGDKKGMAASYNNIGNVYKSQNRYDKALKYYKKGLHIYKEAGAEQWLAVAYNNVGSILEIKKRYRRAMKLYRKSLQLRQKVGDQKGTAACYRSMGSLFLSMGKDTLGGGSLGGREEMLQRVDLPLLDSAKYYQKKAAKIYQKIGMKSGVSSSFIALGDIYRHMNEFNEAVTYYEHGAHIADTIGARPKLYNAYKGLAICHEKLGNIRQSYDYYKKYSVIKDSVYNQKKQKKIAEVEAKYEAEKRKRQLAKQKAELQQQRFLLYGAGGGILLILAFAFILYNRFRITREQKNVIQQQKAVVDKKNKEITDSILYAQRIQQAVLVPEETIKNSLPQSFTLLKPQSIVSGDFYYFAEVRGHIIFSAVDCTGHGVPGAFMSLIGNNLLNQIVHDKDVVTAHQVLNKLDQRLEEALHQKTDLKSQLGIEEHDFVRDGMDMAFSVLHPSENMKNGNGEVTLQFAGANNPLYLISRRDFSEQNSDLKTFDSQLAQSKQSKENIRLYEIPPDKQPIGKQADKKSFTDIELTLQKGDTVYMFSDGFPDQFGGPKGKKFMYSRFRQLLLDIQEKSMEEQKKKLDETIEGWMAENNEEQIDDICVLGVRV